MILSVLVCSLESRARMLAQLQAHLEEQIARAKAHVEVLVAVDNHETPVGLKRQRLVEQAKGEYVCFIDDDDWCPENYVEALVEALESRPDCVGFKVLCDLNGEYKIAAVSKRYSWAENVDGYDYVRSTHHLVPVRRAHALAAGFPSSRFGEDHGYADRLRVGGRLHTEVFVPQFLYEYRFRPGTMAQKFRQPKK